MVLATIWVGVMDRGFVADWEGYGGDCGSVGCGVGLGEVRFWLWVDGMVKDVKGTVRWWFCDEGRGLLWQ